jgi:hypothetical protein
MTFDRNFFCRALHQLYGPVPQPELAQDFATGNATNANAITHEKF